MFVIVAVKVTSGPPAAHRIVRVNVTCGSTPRNEAITVKVPWAPLAVKAGATAMPLLDVVTVAVVRVPAKVPLAPVVALV